MTEHIHVTDSDAAHDRHVQTNSVENNTDAQGVITTETNQASQ